MSIESYIEGQAARQFPGSDVHVTFDEENESFELFLDRNRYYFQCGSDDDCYVFYATHGDLSLPQTIRIELPEAF